VRKSSTNDPTIFESRCDRFCAAQMTDDSTVFSFLRRPPCLPRFFLLRRLPLAQRWLRPQRRRGSSSCTISSFTTANHCRMCGFTTRRCGNRRVTLKTARRMRWCQSIGAKYPRKGPETNGRPDTLVTFRTGQMGNTSSHGKGGSDALEGVFGDGGTL